ncbi:MAG: helix-turn-helix domain-containing protein [Agathobacter sp.]|nr:helix-turn-helix domain-containing protein [Agathobacter sp.]
MISKQKMVNTLNEIKEITNLELVLFSEDGKKLISTYSEVEEKKLSDISKSFPISIESDGDYLLVIYGEHAENEIIGKMAACQVRNLILSKTEEFDRNNFIQNVLLGNMLAIDMHSKAKKLHIEPKPRVTFVIDTGTKSTDVVLELVKNLSDLKAGDFVTTIDEHSVILIKDIANFKEEELEESLEAIAVSLVDSLHMEAMIKVRIGYGNVVEQIPDIAQSYQEAKLALEVGKVFYAERETISYSRLGIGRLIYQLPMSLCDMFIKEVFGDKIPEILDDEESMSTINKFFENNLNISETARQLYVHRNTLVYRLERIEKIIGLDIRKFDDAMTFRIAVMVLAHVKDAKK